MRFSRRIRSVLPFSFPHPQNRRVLVLDTRPLMRCCFLSLLLLLSCPIWSCGNSCRVGKIDNCFATGSATSSRLVRCFHSFFPPPRLPLHPVKHEKKKTKTTEEEEERRKKASERIGIPTKEEDEEKGTVRTWTKKKKKRVRRGIWKERGGTRRGSFRLPQEIFPPTPPPPPRCGVTLLLFRPPFPSLLPLSLRLLFFLLPLLLLLLLACPVVVAWCLVCCWCLRIRWCVPPSTRKPVPCTCIVLCFSRMRVYVHSPPLFLLLFLLFGSGHHHPPLARFILPPRSTTATSVCSFAPTRPFSPLRSLPRPPPPPLSFPSPPPKRFPRPVEKRNGKVEEEEETRGWPPPPPLPPPPSSSTPHSHRRRAGLSSPVPSLASCSSWPTPRKSRRIGCSFFAPS